MKITFEGQFFSDIVEQMRAMVAGLTPPTVGQKTQKIEKLPVSPPAAELHQGPGPEDPFGVDNPVDKPVDKTPALTPGQQQAAKMRAAKEAKAKEREEAAAAAALEAAKVAEATKAAKAKERAANVAARKAAASAPKPEEAPKDEPKPVDPAEAVKIRQKTIEELQAAYANGMQKEVFGLLSKFGNGAKSFRELPADAFGPIREAIDNGALTQ